MDKVKIYQDEIKKYFNEEERKTFEERFYNIKI
jgi:hypothetical protein